MAASVEEFVELLSSEQHVDLARLRHLARHGVHPAVRGEVWMYLLGVLSPDKSHEMTSVRALYNTYDGLFSSYSQPHSFSPKVSQLIQQEAERIWRHRVPHQIRPIRGEQHHPAAGPPRQPPDPSMAKQGTLIADRSLPASTKAQRNVRGPLRTIRALNADCAGQAGDHQHPPPSTAQSASPEEQGTEEEEAKQHFVKRIHNVVSVWIGQKSAAQRDANRLRARLHEEVAFASEGQTICSEDDLEVEGTKSSPRLFIAPKTPPPPLLSSPSSSSSSSQASPSSHSSAHAANTPKTSGERGANAQQVGTPRPTVQQQQQHAAWADEILAGDVGVCQVDRGPAAGVDHRAVEEIDSEDEPFDPAMGMGVEDDEDYGYSDDCDSLEGTPVRSRSSRADTKRGGLRSTQNAIRHDEDVQTTLNEVDHRRIENSTLGNNATNEIQQAVGLGVTVQSQASQSPKPCKARSQARFHPSGRPRSPRSGHTSPLRLRVNQLSSFSSRPRSQGSLSSIGSDEEDDTDIDEAEMEVDEELMEIQEALWKPHLVQLASPFVLISGAKRVEAGIFFAFDKLMTLIETRRNAFPLSHLLATFHTLLRRTLPELRAYFDDEGLDVTPFVKGWLESLFSGQMKLSDGGCLRLWDAYFSSLPTTTPEPASAPTAGAVLPLASSTPLSLHLYVCLAILLHCKDTLEELDRSECESFLRGLPDLDVEKILNEAANLRLSHRQAILNCGEGEGDVDVDGFGWQQGQEEMQRAMWKDLVAQEEVGGEEVEGGDLMNVRDGKMLDDVGQKAQLER